ncbi:MAG: pyridoxamine 5'-phosphate oxidase [Phycisphaerae bacterium]
MTTPADPTLRVDYHAGEFGEQTADPDPIRQFEAWFAQVLSAGLREPNGMTLATCSADGRPEARVVLLKGVDPRGFVFYTNYESRKGRTLGSNARAALCFWWPELERQVRVEGDVERVSDSESDAYFATRPRDSQLGAWASRQSEVLPRRDELMARFLQLAAQHAGRSVPRPPHWGGYRVTPQRIEFWQGRPNRLHDRICYERQADGSWTISRLSP